MDNLYSTFATVSIATILVLVLAYAALWLMRRFQIGTGVSGNSGPELRFIRSLAVGPRERISLIASNGRIYLVGITSGGITKLDDWPEDVADLSGQKMADEPYSKGKP